MGSTGIKKLSFSIEDILATNDGRLGQNLTKSTHATDDLFNVKADALISKQFFQSNTNAYGMFLI